MPTIMPNSVYRTYSGNLYRYVGVYLRHPGDQGSMMFKLVAPKDTSGLPPREWIGIPINASDKYGYSWLNRLVLVGNNYIQRVT